MVLVLHPFNTDYKAKINKILTSQTHKFGREGIAVIVTLLAHRIPGVTPAQHWLQAE